VPAKAAETDSYLNLYEADVPLGGSAHSLRNQMVGQPPMSKPGPHVYASRTDGRSVGLISPERSHACDHMSARSGVRQPAPLVGSPPSMYHGQGLGTAKGGGSATALASDEKYPPMLPPSHSSYSQPPSQTSASGSPLPTRTKSGGLPRYGSPTFPPTTAREAGHLAPLSVAASGVQNVPGAVRRPVSFVRALEMSDQLAGSPAGRPHQRPRAGGLQPTSEEDERAYGSSYEIAV